MTVHAAYGMRNLLIEYRHSISSSRHTMMMELFDLLDSFEEDELLHLKTVAIAHPTGWGPQNLWRLEGRWGGGTSFG